LDVRINVDLFAPIRDRIGMCVLPSAPPNGEARSRQRIVIGPRHLIVSVSLRPDAGGASA
jgi:hypothetical protein